MMKKRLQAQQNIELREAVDAPWEALPSKALGDSFYMDMKRMSLTVAAKIETISNNLTFPSSFLPKTPPLLRKLAAYEFVPGLKRKSNDEEKGFGARVVKNLLEGMEAKHHIVYFNNFFNSVPLLEYLKSHVEQSTLGINIDRAVAVDAGIRIVPKSEDEYRKMFLTIHFLCHLSVTSTLLSEESQHQLLSRKSKRSSYSPPEYAK
ncbi:unnamed protein product [Acanthoscelides obtectus]|uniref:PiggyBac transposable element-derived protein domain-containing protein n=1 Tax=Acanthoscelides obtectus TaxID=200917 RepID=A0A9P0PWT5_ACAOB|nr:unnamed protein product [Acanthoscelides obtectus]CAK1674689.1 hypothetical protein AOBTE_LOCUS29706 [Acanthoscelides obtectus]